MKSTSDYKRSSAYHPAIAEPARTRDAAATTERLLVAAQRRFILLGYARTTTRAIAEDAGANVSLINRYFGGKQGLFEAVLERSSAELTAVEAPADVDGIVEQFIARLRPGAEPDLGAHPLLLLVRDDNDDPRLVALRRQTLLRAIERLGGDDVPPLRAQLVLALLYGTVALRESARLQPLSTADDDELRTALTDAVRALLEG